MRLLNAHTIRLENFENDTTIPRYAILSHTWGFDEVTFADLQQLSVPTASRIRASIMLSTGYYKISKACWQAIQDGFHYLWSDTCCINKDSSAELSEAINSMFRWYRRAEVCYAYLDDVDMFDEMRRGFASGNEEKFWQRSLDLLDEKDLAQARWFTRGWTLQELIAPKNVMFYIKGWKYVGNKTSMRAKLARITGIDEHILIGGDLDSVSVARRMSWAAKRQTTKTEDMAYCLLGIFDVNMPLLYGEGTKAFARLQEEIMRELDDQTLFAWLPHSLPPPHIVDIDHIQSAGLLKSSKPRTPKGKSESARGGTVEAPNLEPSLPAFAQHPCQFSAANVLPTDTRGQPYTLTNRGVRMRVPLLELDRDRAIYLIVLECSVRDGSSHQLGLVVQRVRGGSVFRFVRLGGVGLVQVTRAMLQIAKIRTVYLCKKVPADAGRGEGGDGSWKKEARGVPSVWDSKNEEEAFSRDVDGLSLDDERTLAEDDDSEQDKYA